MSRESRASDNDFAFKEWASVVDLLGAGHQSIIIRKGGLAEGREGFQAAHQRFWLFPTGYHDEGAKLRDDAPSVEMSSPADGPVLELRFFAELKGVWFEENWSHVKLLHDLHFWRETTLRERFDYLPKSAGEFSRPGIHVLFVRIYEAAERVILDAAEPHLAGCRSWIHTGAALPSAGRAVMSDEAFAEVKDAADKVLG